MIKWQVILLILIIILLLVIINDVYSAPKVLGLEYMSEYPYIGSN